MVLTIEELYAFKEKYATEIEELNRKMAVVDEFIAFAEAKAPVEEVVEVQEETETANEDVELETI